MNYDEVRSLLQTGDIIGVKENKSWLHKLTQFFTHKDYTHVGAIKIDSSGVYLAELNGGRNHSIPMSQLKDKKFDVYECPIECFPYMEDSINRWLRFEIPYGFKSFILIGLNKYFGWKLPVNKADIVCTGFVVNILTTAGWKLDVPTAIDPGTLLSLFTLKYKINQ